jgi:hypothetical protein
MPKKSKAKITQTPQEHTHQQTDDDGDGDDDDDGDGDGDDDAQTANNYWQHAGFKGGTYLGGTSPLNPPVSTPISTECTNPNRNYEGWKYDHGHLAMTYVALYTLATLGDDLTGIDRSAIVMAMGTLQREDGRPTVTL